MFARVQTVHEPADRLDQLTAIARTQLPKARELPGYRGFSYLVDRASGKALVVSYWETEEDLRAVEANTAMRERTAAEAGTVSPPSEVFEVALQDS
jgi:heme-degrading monooxygenase HmoA